MVKILLVEDDSNLREIYSARLEAEGYEIVSASDGEEALAIAVRERPELIISDVMMPKISGFDMLDILRSTPETKDVKVIVMTALSQEEDRQRGEKLGADRYLVKSQVTLDDVVAIVRELTAPGGQTGIPAATTAAQPATPSDDASPQQDVPAVSPLASDQPAPSTPPAPTYSSTAVAQDEPSLNNEVAEFVATSPLMNGVAPQPPQAPAESEDETPPQPPVEPTSTS